MKNRKTPRTIIKRKKTMKIKYFEDFFALTSGEVVSMVIFKSYISVYGKV
jgi:hypothetical protein